MHLLPATTLSGENRVHHADLFTLCNALPDASVDMVLCDLPYGTLNGVKWDVVIPFAPMWEAFKRVTKPNAAIVLTAAQPFTSMLVCSNLPMFHEEIIWDKVAGTGYFDANRKHLKAHENVLVFCDGQPTYNPQMGKGDPYKKRRSSNFDGYGNAEPTLTVNDGERYPKSIVTYSASTAAYQRLHPTQKSEDLFAYLIRTYSKPGDLVLDPCCGSGTTAVSARATQRRFICGDKEWDYIQIARRRLAEPFTLPMFTEDAS